MSQSDIPIAALDRRRGVVGVVQRQGLLLAVQRSALVVAPGAWCFPGGHVEPGESEESALAREFLEELSVAVRPLRRIWQSVTPWEVALAWWTVSLDEQSEPRPNLTEISAFRWCSAQAMIGLDNLLPNNGEFLARVLAGELTL